MRSSFFLFLLIFSLNAKANESVSLYAQGCLPYVEGGSNIFLDCAPEEIISIELKNSNAGEGLQIGTWDKIVNIGNSSFIVSLIIQKIASRNGSVSIIFGTISQSNGVQLVFAANTLTPDSTSVSLQSLIPYGDKGGLPCFFFGNPYNFNSATNALIIKRALGK